MQTRNAASTVRQTPQLITQQIGLETLVYDERTHQAYCLNPVAAEVWKRRETHEPPAKVAKAVSVALGTTVTEEIVSTATAELREIGLLEPDWNAATANSRRKVLCQLGAGALVMLPAVAAVMAPRAAQAYTGCFDCTAAPPDPDTESSKPRMAKDPRFYSLPQVATPDRAFEHRTSQRRDGELFVP